MAAVVGDIHIVTGDTGAAGVVSRAAAQARRARPMEMGPASPPDESFLGPMYPEEHWITPIPDAKTGPETTDPAELAQYRESIRLAFVTALQHLPARQRASDRQIPAGRRAPQGHPPGRDETARAALRD